MPEPFHLQPPVHLVNCVIAEQTVVDALLTDLSNAGYTGENVVSVLHGEADLRRIDPDGTHHGGLARFMRAFQKRATDVDGHIINAAEDALNNGQYLVGVITDGSEVQRDEVHQIMQVHDGKQIFYTGRFVTHLLSGW